MQEIKFEWPLEALLKPLEAFSSPLQAPFEETMQVLFPALKKLHLCTLQNLAMYRKVFPHLLIFLSL